MDIEKFLAAQAAVKDLSEHGKLTLSFTKEIDREAPSMKKALFAVDAILQDAELGNCENIKENAEDLKQYLKDIHYYIITQKFKNKVLKDDIKS